MWGKQGIVKGWPSGGTSSHTKTVVALLYWKGEVLGLFPEKVGENGVLGAFLAIFSPKLVDHIYTNNLYSHADAGIIITDVVDHFGVFYVHKY